MNLRFVAGLSVCALAATIASVLPFFIVAGGDVLNGGAIFLLAVAAILNCLIGIPVSMDTYRWLLRRRKLTLGAALLTANVWGSLLAALTWVFLGMADFLFFGIPTLLAANTWAICGWYVVAKPQLGQSPGA